jgi:Fur family peroxide stress response transcriptional regulator
MDSTSQYLSQHGIRPSVQRLAIMHYLWNEKTHPSADEIFDSLRKQIPSLSKTTVYNTLKLFIDRGAATYVGIDDRNARFDGIVEPHAHFRCKKCGKIIDLDFDVERFLPKNFNGKIEETYFYLKGRCEDCNNTP